MDRYELAGALLRAGQPPESFQLPDAHETTPVPPDFWFLRRAADGRRWEIGAYERGRYDVRAGYDSEAAACAGLYAVLTGTSPIGTDNE